VNRREFLATGALAAATPGTSHAEQAATVGPASSVALTARLLDAVEPSRYECITLEPGGSPIVAFLARDTEGLGERLGDASIAVGNGPAPRERGPAAPLRHVPRLRISPAIFNNEDDVDALAAALNG
jgi:selenocysteine lyase/cysteine desulfurase